jgi:hypothetical protein
MTSLLPPVEVSCHLAMGRTPPSCPSFCDTPHSSQLALAEAVAAGHPCGAPLPHPAAPIQPQPQARSTPPGSGPLRRAAATRWGQGMAASGSAGGCVVGGVAQKGLLFFYPQRVSQLAERRRPQSWGRPSARTYGGLLQTRLVSARQRHTVRLCQGNVG